MVDLIVNESFEDDVPSFASRLQIADCRLQILLRAFCARIVQPRADILLDMRRIYFW